MSPKEILWTERITEFCSSGLTSKQWRMEYKISPSTMEIWMSMLGG